MIKLVYVNIKTNNTYWRICSAVEDTQGVCVSGNDCNIIWFDSEPENKK